MKGKSLVKGKQRSKAIMTTKQMGPTPLPGRPDSEFEEYEYKKVVWKDFIRKPKYIRVYTPWRLAKQRLD